MLPHACRSDEFATATLLSQDLSDVNCALSSSIIIVSDNSRPSNEADAQSTRAVVLIDELILNHEAKLTSAGQGDTYEPPNIVRIRLLSLLSDDLLDDICATAYRSITARAP